MTSTSPRRISGTLALALASLVGAASFLYPFFLPTLAGVGVQTARGGIEVPLLFTAIGVLALLLILVELQDGMESEGGGTKHLALLGVLVAVDASLRLMPTLLGASPIFLLIILVGYCYGARFGFLMGSMTLLVSALITGGLGPWLPYQMLGAGWIGMTAGWLPRRSGAAGGWFEVGLLAAFGALWGFLYGAILNLTEWPYAAPGLQERAGLYWTPGMGLAETLATYLRFYITTSLVYDSFRAIANVALVLLLARPVVRLLDRYRARFTWQPWAPYEPLDDTAQLPRPAR